jgi:hypothetical protein
MEIGNFQLANLDKLERALNGHLGNDGHMTGGVANLAYQEDGVWKREGAELSEKEVATLEAAILVEYDRIGGLIKRDGEKVATGGFYDFKAKTAHKTPQVKVEYRIGERVMLVPDGEAVPNIVKAQKLMKEEDAEVKVKKGKK